MLIGIESVCRIRFRCAERGVYCSGLWGSATWFGVYVLFFFFFYGGNDEIQVPRRQRQPPASSSDGPTPTPSATSSRNSPAPPTTPSRSSPSPSPAATPTDCQVALAPETSAGIQAPRVQPQHAEARDQASDAAWIGSPFLRLILGVQQRSVDVVSDSVRGEGDCAHCLWQRREERRAASF
ncbi:hypothetical protein MRB53_012196 [Persea americana]|uniref:Uncharacterized protein n=1 Tax=Persea americana TaxID=3435 RepID=A0ACC2LWW4_PERAE|nr:hypothetical protein MRB53_012196 [Persea americana]